MLLLMQIKDIFQNLNSKEAIIRLLFLKGYAMKIQFLPLDERPCNEAYIRHLYGFSNKVHVEVIDKKDLGHKKTPTSWSKIRKFLDESSGYDASVLSLDMFFYGGLIPSRLHLMESDDLHDRFTYLKSYLKRNEGTKIYAFQTLMRTPHYNSSEEEPDYYGQYGEKIFRKAYLEDKKDRDGLTNQEESELLDIAIPDPILEDYTHRRQFNLSVLKKTLKLVQDGWIDFLVIPQDDSSPYGYTAQEQRQLYQYIETFQLWDRVMIYPGADEVALSLISRSILEQSRKTFKVYPVYSSTLGPYIIPLYEDRPMYETLKSHLNVIGIQLSETARDADYILAINAPGRCMEEASQQKHRDVSYSSHRNLSMFIQQIETFLCEGHRVALLDTAYANGGDLVLTSRLDKQKLLERLCAYSAWNTHANSLGTLLSMLTIMYVEGEEERFKCFSLSYRLIEDLLYQAQVRQDVIRETLPKLNASYYDFNYHQKEVEKDIYHRLRKSYNAMHISKKYPFKVKSIYMPWNRMFEIGMDI